MGEPPDLLGLAIMVFSILWLAAALMLYAESLAAKIALDAAYIPKDDQMGWRLLSWEQNVTNVAKKLLAFIFSGIVVILWASAVIHLVDPDAEFPGSVLRRPWLIAPGPFLASFYPSFSALFRFNFVGRVLHQHFKLAGRADVIGSPSVFLVIASSVVSVVGFFGSVATLIGEAPLQPLYKSLRQSIGL